MLLTVLVVIALVAFFYFRGSSRLDQAEGTASAPVTAVQLSLV